MERSYENRIVNKGQVISNGELILKIQILTLILIELRHHGFDPLSAVNVTIYLILCKPETRSSKVF